MYAYIQSLQGAARLPSAPCPAPAPAPRFGAMAFDFALRNPDGGGGKTWVAPTGCLGDAAVGRLWEAACCGVGFFSVLSLSELRFFFDVP